MKIESNKASKSYINTEATWNHGKEITLDGVKLIPITVIDKIVAEIEKLSCVSFTMGNGEVVETPLVNKDVVANIVKKFKESEDKE